MILTDSRPTLFAAYLGASITLGKAMVLSQTSSWRVRKYVVEINRILGGSARSGDLVAHGIPQTNFNNADFGNH